jgi:hypothetical protein
MTSEFGADLSLPDAADVPLDNTTPLTRTLCVGPVVTSYVAQGSGNPPVDGGAPGKDTIDPGYGTKFLYAADNFAFAKVEALTSAALPQGDGFSYLKGDSFDFSALTSALHGADGGDAAIVHAVEHFIETFAALQGNAGNPWENLASPVDVAQPDGGYVPAYSSALFDKPPYLAQSHSDLLV